MVVITSEATQNNVIFRNKKRRKILILVVMMVMVLAVSMQTHAGLSVIGQGTSTHGMYNLIYDDDFDLTWHDFTMTGKQWQQQKDWAVALSVTFGANTYVMP